MSPRRRLPALRHRDGHHARVTYEELFFDLVYVFAVTQLSHHLLHHLDLAGVLQTLVLWFAVWLGWQYACWVSNWFDPEAPRIRGLLFATMLLALLMSSSIPEAFADRAWVFAGAYATMQVGRTSFVLLEVGTGHPLAANFRRMLAWVSVSACFWLAGAAAEGNIRLALWALAVACEYISPMFGFAFPGLGRSHTREWTIEGGHLAERCQLFVIVALGETLLATGGCSARSNTGVWRWCRRCWRPSPEHWRCGGCTSASPVAMPPPRSPGPTTPAGWGQLPLRTRAADRRHHRHRGGQRPGHGPPGDRHDLEVRRHDGGRSAALPAGQCPLQARGLRPRAALLGALVLLALGLALPWTHLLAAGWLTSLVLLGVGLLDTRLAGRTRQRPG